MTTQLEQQVKALHEQLEQNEKQFGEANAKMEAMLGAIATMKKETPFPKVLTVLLEEALGLQRSHVANIARIYRASGIPIGTTLAEEQAYSIFQATTYALTIGEGWKEKMAEDLVTLDSTNSRIILAH
jgi:hypothetical protein